MHVTYYNSTLSLYVVTDPGADVVAFTNPQSLPLKLLNTPSLRQWGLPEDLMHVRIGMPITMTTDLRTAIFVDGETVYFANVVDYPNLAYDDAWLRLAMETVIAYHRLENPNFGRSS